MDSPNNLPVKFDSELIKSLTEPMMKIIEVVSKAVGTVYAPTKIVKESKAKAKAKIYEKIGDLISEELDQRGLDFFIHQLGQKQFNIENIINKALKQQLAIDNQNPSVKQNQQNEAYKLSTLSDSSAEPDKSWMLDFFDLCQNSTEDEIQEIWAALLRSEVDKPGSVSRRLMHSIRIMSASEAKTFQAMADCVLLLLQGTINIYEKESNEKPNQYFGCITVVGDTELYENDKGDYVFGFNLHDTVILEEIGLINRIQFFSEEDDAREIRFSEDSNIKFSKAEFEICDFTYLGLELSELIRDRPNSEYQKLIIEEFKNRKMIKED